MTESRQRPHPFELMFAPFRAEQFPAIREAIGAANDVDSFLLSAPAIELLRDLRPDEGVGAEVDDFVALIHAAFLFWRDGEHTVSLSESETRDACRSNRSATESEFNGPTKVAYVQVAPRIIWAQLSGDDPFEPLDGWFAIPAGAALRLVACFGVHEERPGVTIATVEGPIPGNVIRTDSRPLFAPAMPGGDAADLHAVTGPGELLLLGWRAANVKEIS